jgi:putative transposase
MTHHVHLLAEPGRKDGIKRMIQSLARRYVGYINATYKRTGTLWQGRYKSSVVSKESYLLACCRYIELNPVRAKIVKDPSQCPSSSYSFRAQGKPHKLLTEEPVYRAFGDRPSERQRVYQKWIKESIPDGQWSTIRRMTQRGGLIGDQNFFNRISNILSRDIIFRSRGRPRRGSEKQL